MPKALASDPTQILTSLNYNHYSPTLAPNGLDEVVAKPGFGPSPDLGSSEAFAPALRLYESAGFTRCEPFDGYIDNRFGVFMTRRV